MTAKKFYFSKIHEGLWAFYYYGNFTGAIVKDIVESTKWKYVETNGTLERIKLSPPKFLYHVSLEHVFWKGQDFAESGDVYLTLPSRGEAKKFLMENAALSSIMKNQFGTNSHHNTNLNFHDDIIPLQIN